jgi:hypothetical protein
VASKFVASPDRAAMLRDTNAAIDGRGPVLARLHFGEKHAGRVPG